jgi:hypothetical protein
MPCHPLPQIWEGVENLGRGYPFAVKGQPRLDWFEGRDEKGEYLYLENRPSVGRVSVPVVMS